MSAPLPCPFCGCKDIAVVEGSTFRWRLAQCNGCGAQGPDVRIQTSGSGTKEEWEQSALDGALTEWNRRHAEADLAAARAERDLAQTSGVEHANYWREQAKDYQEKLDQWKHDYAENREISRGQARRIRELLSRLGEPCAPDIGLPPDEVGPLRDQLAAARARVAELETLNEQLQVQLAGCGVAALQNTRTSIAEQRIGRDAWGNSASYEEVCNAVDREIEWRERAERAEADLAAARAERDAAFKMSRCECSADECCANLVKLHDDLAAARALLKDARPHILPSWNATISVVEPIIRRIDAALAGQRREGEK